MGSAALPALGGDRAGILAGRVTVRADPRGLLHLVGRPAMLIKSYNLHENDKAKCEETDRVCPQPNPFCLSTFDLNSSRNTGSAARGQY